MTASDSRSREEANDLTEEMISASKRRTRVNALILAIVFALMTFAPHPWSTFAPLLFLLPLLRAFRERIRRNDAKPYRGGTSEREEGFPPDPYATSPSDPKDPRRYRPIE